MPHAAVQPFRLLCDAIRHCFSGVQGLRNRLLRGTGLCRELRQKRRSLRRCPDFIRRINPHPASSFRSDVFSLREPGPEHPRHSCREAPLPSGAKPGCQTGRRTSAADRSALPQTVRPTASPSKDPVLFPERRQCAAAEAPDANRHRGQRPRHGRRAALLCHPGRRPQDAERRSQHSGQRSQQQSRRGMSFSNIKTRLPAIHYAERRVRYAVIEKITSCPSCFQPCPCSASRQSRWQSW